MEHISKISGVNAQLRDLVIVRKGTNKYKFRADIDHVKRETLTNGITDPFRSRNDADSDSA